MIPTNSLLVTLFRRYNQLYFGGRLPSVMIGTNMRWHQRGITKWSTINGRNCKFCIEISAREDLSEEELHDTLVHEMIHLDIASQQLHDTSPHGRLFTERMNDLNARFGLHIQVKFDRTDEQLMHTNIRPRYFCVARLDDGHRAIAVVAKTRIYELWDEMSLLPGVHSVEWYGTCSAIITRLPAVQQPKLYVVADDFIDKCLVDATLMTRVDGQIMPECYARLRSHRL